jgi:hypothetical protein
MRTGILVILLWIVNGVTAYSQNYKAINGSSYAGSLGIGNNPASIVNTPFKWDINAFSFQVTNSTNAVTVFHYSLLSSGKNSEYLFTGGDYGRFAYVNYNINLFNARFAINRQKAFAFGVNLRGYTNAETSPYNFIDTVKSSREFFGLGNFTRTLSAKVRSSNWIEVFGTYSQTIWDRIADRLNAGITLKITRGYGGGFGDLENGRVHPAIENGKTIYLADNLAARYAYSRNFDAWNKNNNTSFNLKNFLSDNEGSASVDLGFEYLIKSKAVPTVFDDEEEYYDYEWKIGLSLLDAGFNKYKFSKNSLFVSGIRSDIADSTLDDKFKNTSASRLGDSLKTIVKNSVTPAGVFNITSPMRLVLNVDRYLGGNFFVNGDLSINLTPLDKKGLYVKELNLLTLTPRWETKRLGVYLPVQVNTQGRLWIGGAFKAGPLLFGIHNWANVFSNKKINNGGGYLALVIRSMNHKNERLDKRLNCPTY